MSPPPKTAGTTGTTAQQTLIKWGVVTVVPVVPFICLGGQWHNWLCTNLQFILTENKMTDENLVPFPAGPGQFLSLLERVGQLSHWHVRHTPMPAGALTTFTTSSGNVNLGRVPHVLYFEGELPAVRLGDDMMFDLVRLFERGEEWDPKVYSTNSFMPAQFKEFLDQLFAVLVAHRALRAQAREQAMALAA